MNKRAWIGWLALLVAAPVGAQVQPPPELEVPYIGADMVKPLYDRGEVVMIDVRGDTAYRAEHIRGALNFSLVMLREGKMPPLPKTMPLVTYCGCPHSMAEEGARYLRAAGFEQVYVLDEGFEYWKQQGYPVNIDHSKAGALRKMTLTGFVPGLPAGTRVYAHHADSDQWEAGLLAADGSFELHLPFYGVDEAAAIVVMAGDRRATVPFRAGGSARVDLR